MISLIIKYKDGEGNITERRISEIAPEGQFAISAYCHLRQGKRTFVIKRICYAAYVDSGEVVENLYECFGLPLPNEVKKAVSLPESLSFDRQRNKEKYEFFKRFQHPAIADLYRYKLFSMFNHQCFKCGLSDYFDIDHHIPMVLGGRLIPGNLVVLCKKCNNKKHDSHPKDFYTPEELDRLEPILLAQTEVFNFQLDLEQYDKNKRDYLLSLGVDPDLEIDEIDAQYNDEYWVSVELKNRKVSAKLEIKYRSKNNEFNIRIFELRGFSRGNEGYHIHGYCHRRKKNSTLSSRGILEAVDIETGEFIENIINYLEEKYKETPQYLKDLLFDEYDWALYALAYACSPVSEKITKAESNFIGLFIKSIPHFNDVEISWVSNIVRNLRYPSKIEIRKLVKIAIQKGTDFTMLFKTIDNLSQLKKENRELQLLKNYIEKQINIDKAASQSQAS